MDRTSEPDDSEESKMDRPGWFLQVDCTPEELAQAIFANARPPDPSLRKRATGKTTEERRKTDGMGDTRTD